MDGVRALGLSDMAQIWALLDADPLGTLFISSRIDAGGIDPAQLGCRIWGYERAGRIISVCHAGVNLVPVGGDESVMEAYAEKFGPRRFSQSIMGRSTQVMWLYRALTKRWGPAWGASREIRAHQPLLAIHQEPSVEPDTRIQPVTMDYFQPYFTAAVAMYTEEVGTSPLDPVNSYQRYVQGLISSRHAFGGYLPGPQEIDASHIGTGRFWFKSDIGCAHATSCQVQGVWLHPELRGKGLSEGAMAQVVHLARFNYPTVSLYVNDFNYRARAMYERVGFHQVGELATILY